jgi:Zn-finger nucleic acid-binding protein
MKCPVCQTVDLKMSERQGIEIDYCPQCRGVWLDRGELDKIIERSAAAEGYAQQRPPAPPMPPPQQGYMPPTQQGYPPRYDDDDDDRYRYDPYTGKRKRRGTLGDLFDIFD